MKRTYPLSLLATALLLSGLSAMAQVPTPAAPLPETASTSQARIDAQSEQVSSYWKAKAQCWAALSRAAGSQGDAHNTAVIAAVNAKRIQDALQAGEEPTGAEQPIFSRKFVPSKDQRYGRRQWRDGIETIDAVLKRYNDQKCRTAKL